MPPAFSPLIWFDKIVKQAPFNTVLFPDDFLLGKARLGGGNSTLEKASPALAELLVRHFLTHDAKYRQPLDSLFGKEAMDDFEGLAAQRLKGVQIDDVYRPLRKSAMEPQVAECVLGVVRRRFGFLLGADGLIPVFDEKTHIGYLLPFALEKTEGDKSLVIDLAGEEIPAWTMAVRALPDPGKNRFRIRVGITVRHGFGEPLPLTGRSLMLPVQMALWRHSGDLPHYSPFSIVSTGLFDDSGHLDIVEAKDKAIATAKLPEAVFIYPSDFVEARSKTACPIRAGAEWKGVFDRVRDIAEERFVSDSVYAISRLNSAELAAEMDIGRYGEWEGVVRRLENMLSKVSRMREPQAYLACLMMLGMANCHAAHTEDALKWNRKARAFAQSVSGFEYQLTRLKIELLVMLTDTEDFEALFKSAEELCTDDLDKLGSEADDLRMRYLGTMGQAFAYAALAGVYGDGGNRARDSFVKAFQAAERLRRAEQDGDRLDRRWADVAHDANYLHLWDVLFDSAATSESREEAERDCKEIKGDKPKRKNHVFLMRQVALGLYRRLLMASETEGAEAVLANYRNDKLLIDNVLGDPEVESWIRATMRKYRGALLAAAGNAKDALTDFEEGMDLIRTDASDAVVRKIRMTICAEACRSLAVFPEFRAQSEKFRGEGLSFFAGETCVPTINLKWKEFLENPSAPFPGLSYWY